MEAGATAKKPGGIERTSRFAGLNTHVLFT